MDLQIAGRVALVTGASSGIGEAVALALAAEGVKLALAARRREKLETVAQACRAAGAPDVHAIELDLTSSESIERCLQAVRDSLGAPDILIANGGGPRFGPYLAMKRDDWDAAYQLVMRSVLLLVEGVLPAMRERRFGRIVALESSSVKAPIPNLVLSNAFRAGVLGALKTLSREVAADGVTVNVIATGRIATDRLRASNPDPESYAKMEAEIPVKRAGSPAEFAPMVAFLCGVPAGYVTGTTIPIDGGMLPTLS